MAIRPITIPVTFDSANRRKDRSIKLSFSTNLEVNTADYAEMDKLIQQSGWLLFSPNELVSEDVPKEDAPSDVKRPSVRLRGALWHVWDKNTDRAEPFEHYYQRQMEKLVSLVKEQIDG
jgi:hypothetical protein